MSEVSDGLPAGWGYRRLGDVLRLQNGYAFKPTHWSTHGLPIIRIQNLNVRGGAFNRFDGELPPKYRASSGDLLFAWSGTPGTSFGAHVWTGGDAWINQHIFRVDFSADEYDRDFLRLALNANLYGYISGAQGGVGLAHITKAKLNESQILTPPPPVQRRIAMRISDVEAKRESCTDRLVAGQRAVGLYRATALADAYRRAANGDDESTIVPLSQILREPLKNGYSARPVHHETPFRVLTLTATTSGYFDGQYFKYTDESFEPDSPFWLMPGDLVIQRGNTEEYVGAPALYDGEPRAYVYPDLMIRARVREDIDPRFVWYMLQAPQARQYLRDRATGSAGNMPKINQTVLKSVPVPMPDVATRSGIVAQLDRALDIAAGIETRISMAMSRVERSSQAVLAKAFRGELVTG